jgi:predicted nicotinamide N-methyase
MFNAKQFISKYTRLQYLDFVPEIRLFLREDNMLQSFLKQEGIDSYPNWAYSWVGGQALARYILDNDIVKDKIVVDYCSGGGIVGIAAKMAGAKEVICVDNDPLSFEAVALNAKANGVMLRTSYELHEADIMLAGDPALQQPIFDLLKSKNAIIGCPIRRSELLNDFVCIETYEIQTFEYMDAVNHHVTHIFR